MKHQDSPYRKVPERILLLLAGLGILLTAHLSFWYGATAAADPVCTGASDCAAVIAQDPTLFGLSSAAAGLMFYLLVALLTFAVALDLLGRRRQFKAVRFVVTLAGFAYSLFLTVLQLFALDDFCILCFASFLMVTAMVLLLWLTPRMARGARRRKVAAPGPGEMKVFGTIAAVVLMGVLADYTWYKSKVPEVGTVANLAFNPALCRYDESMPRFENLDQFISDTDPMTGYPTALVTVLEFIDPNCPACKLQHPVMKQLAARYPQSVRIVYKPVALLQGSLLFSLDEVMALWLAQEQGRYDAMVEAMFEAQKPEGLSVAELTDIADDVGMDATVFRQDLESRRLEPRARSVRHVFDGMGLDAVPTILINGRKVDNTDRSLGCLSHLVDQELPGGGTL